MKKIITISLIIVLSALTTGTTPPLVHILTMDNAALIHRQKKAASTIENVMVILVILAQE